MRYWRETILTAIISMALSVLIVLFILPLFQFKEPELPDYYEQMEFNHDQIKFQGNTYYHSHEFILNENQRVVYIPISFSFEDNSYYNGVELYLFIEKTGLLTTQITELTKEQLDAIFGS